MVQNYHYSFSYKRLAFPQNWLHQISKSPAEEDSQTNTICNFLIEIQTDHQLRKKYNNCLRSARLDKLRSITTHLQEPTQWIQTSSSTRGQHEPERLPTGGTRGWCELWARRMTRERRPRPPIQAARPGRRRSAWVLAWWGTAISGRDRRAESDQADLMTGQNRPGSPEMPGIEENPVFIHQWQITFHPYWLLKSCLPSIFFFFFLAKYEI